jgi:hypothetical protein
MYQFKPLKLEVFQTKMKIIEDKLGEEQKEELSSI